MADISEEVRNLALEAKEASIKLGLTTTEERNAALEAMADALCDHVDDIVAANKQDMNSARDAGTSEAILDRLMLDESRINAMADSLKDLMCLPDPIGCIQKENVLYNDILLQRVSVPIGVVAMIYEARPNVTSDAAGICIKSANACVLRGGSLAQHSNEVIANILSDAAVSAGMPQGCIEAITTSDREATDALMQLHGIVDVLIPRGGAGLIRHCVDSSKVPVIETGTGNCHVYVHKSADLEQARNIVLNAKCRRFGVCNAAETLLVDASIAQEFLPDMCEALAQAGVTMHCDEEALCAASAKNPLDSDMNLVAATEKDWETEYLSPDIAIKCVNGVEEAIEHINRYGTKHSEAIVATDEDAIERFLTGVDAAAVYANASTAFTDGGQFGLGAEIGISTQKLHARGPFALDALTSYKYILRGDGQVRA